MKIAKIEWLHADAGTPNTHMHAVRRQASGGVVQRAIAAIENAMLDAEARPLGIPATPMPDLTDGSITLPTGPGWGTKIDGATVRAHPSQQP